MSRTHRRGRRPRRPFRRMTDDVGPARRAKGARAVPAKSHTLGGGRYREHRGKRGCKRSRRTSAAGQARQTRNARAGVKIGCRVQPAPSVDRRTAHRGRCALRRVGNVSALQIRHPSSNGRGVGDAAPYGQKLNHGISIVANRCVSAANLCPPLGSPERGAVAARSAVTEGLVQGRCGVPTLPVIPRPGGRGSPPLRGVGRWVRKIKRRLSTDAGAGVEAGWRVEPTSAVNRQTAHRGRCALRCVGKVSAS